MPRGACRSSPLMIPLVRGCALIKAGIFIPSVAVIVGVVVVLVLSLSLCRLFYSLYMCSEEVLMQLPGTTFEKLFLRLRNVFATSHNLPILGVSFGCPQYASLFLSGSTVLFSQEPTSFLLENHLNESNLGKSRHFFSLCHPQPACNRRYPAAGLSSMGLNTSLSCPHWVFDLPVLSESRPAGFLPD